MFKLFLLTAVLLGLGFAGIAIKIWAKKDGEFEGTCAGKNAKLRAKGINCGCGGSGSCQNEGEHHDHDHDHHDIEHQQTIFVKNLAK
jgi:hypothetical protein